MQLHEARHAYVRWLSATRDLSEHTIRAYDGDIAAFERIVGATSAVATIDRAAIVDFLEHLREGGLSPRTIRRRASGNRGMCRWLLAIGVLDNDPWTGVTLPAGTTRTLPRTVPDGILDSLLASLRDRAQLDAQLNCRDSTDDLTTLLAVVLMLTTGVRVGEVASIRCQDVDLARRTIRITGKGRRERVVFLTNDWVTDLVRAYLDARRARSMGHERLLFNNHLDPLTPPALRARLRKAVILAGLASPVTPHMLRHSAATKLIEAGVDIRLIQALLGHASLSTTEIYTHVSNVALQRAVTEVDVLRQSLAC